MRIIKNHTKIEKKLKKTKTHRKIENSIIIILLAFSIGSIITPVSANGETSTIYGYITDSTNNKPIQNATISVYSNFDYNSTTTDSNGYYIINVTAGDIYIDVAADGYFDSSTEFYTINESDILWANISLDPYPPQNSVIQGYITDELTNNPIEDVNIDVFWHDDQGNSILNFTSTDSTGFYSVNVAEGEASLTFSANGYADKSTPFNNINSNDVLQIDISLSPEKSIIHGIVTNGITDEGVENATVTVYWTDAQGEEYYNDTLTNSFGYYEINVAAVDINLSVEADGYFYKFIEVGFITINESKEVNISIYGPCNPSPLDGKTGVDINTDLNWACGEENNNITYDVYFGTSSNPPKVTSSPQSSTTYDPDKLDYDTTYYWQIIAWNMDDERAEGPIWHFTTKKQENTGGNPPSIGPPSDNKKGPIADAGGPYYDYMGNQIQFDGSNSNDPDGNIIKWEWNFGDGTTADGIKTTHTYTKPGNYTVTLKVTDNDGLTNTDTTYAIISETPNYPPKNLKITGETHGKKNQNYNYTFTATDPDNDTITYNINWGDGNNITIENLTNGTAYKTNHTWNNYGIYKITFKATDQNNATTTKTITIYIDIQTINELNGYLIDENTDDIYDLFHNNTTNNNTAVKQQTDGKYLIDDNGDRNWDYIYDPQIGLEPYHENSEDKGTPGFSVIFLILSILIVAVLTKRRKI